MTTRHQARRAGVEMRRADAAREVAPLAALKNALAHRGVDTRLEVLPVPYLTVWILHLSGHHLGVSVLPGRAAPDRFTWHYAHYQHLASDPEGAADRLAAHVHRLDTDP